MTGWKKWLFVGLGFGAGAAVVAAIIFGGVAWYSSRPQLWNSDGIRATFSTPIYSTDDDFNLKGIELEYIIDNNTSRDYTLSPDQPFLLQDGGALRSSFTGMYKVSDQCFIPAGCPILSPAFGERVGTRHQGLCSTSHLTMDGELRRRDTTLDYPTQPKEG